jgi:hypothetical protein
MDLKGALGRLIPKGLTDALAALARTAGAVAESAA